MNADQPTPNSLYPTLLGLHWQELSAVVRCSHAEGIPVRGTGTFQIKWGNSWWARLLARLLRMPPPTNAVETRLLITPDMQGEIWLRTFGDRRLVTTQRAHPSGFLVERIGIIEFRFRLEAERGGLSYRQTGAALWLGAGTVSLPQWLSPHVEAREESADEDPLRTQVQVMVRVPLIGHLISYRGHLFMEGEPT